MLSQVTEMSSEKRCEEESFILNDNWSSLSMSVMRSNRAIKLLLRKSSLIHCGSGLKSSILRFAAEVRAK